MVVREVLLTVQEARRTVLVPTDLGGPQVLAKFFRALVDPTRLALLEFLVEDAHTVGKCMEHVGLSQGRVSAHLGCLADCGYVVARPAARNTYYRVADPRVAELVLLARSLAADNTAALADCARIDIDIDIDFRSAP